MTNIFNEEYLLTRMAEHDDKSAFEVIYKNYWNDLYMAAYRRLKNREQAEDIVQEIFVRFWENRAKLHVEDLSAYLHTAVRYRIYNYISRDALTETFYEPFETIAAFPFNADYRILEEELLNLMNDYIAALSRKRRLVFNLYFNEQLSTGEIATQLRISRKTVQNHLGTVMKGLRTHVSSSVILMILLSLLGH